MASSAKKQAAGKTSPMPDLGDMDKLLKQFKLPGIDADAMVEWQRKDLAALAEANRQAFEGMKVLAQRQAEILRENLAQWQEAMQSAPDKDALAKQGAAIQRGMQKAMKDFQELAAIEAKARTEAWKVVQDRLQENMASLQKLMNPRK